MIMSMPFVSMPIGKLLDLLRFFQLLLFVEEMQGMLIPIISHIPQIQKTKYALRKWKAVV